MPNQPEEITYVPKSLEAEESVLAAILTDPEAIAKVQYLKPEDFYNTNHQLIYKACLELVKNDKEIDAINVVEILKHHNKLKDAGGSHYITGLETPSTALIETHAKLIKEYANKRQLQLIGWQIYEDPHQDFATSITDFQTRIQELIEETPINGYIPGLNLKTLEYYVTDETKEPPMILSKGLLPKKSILIIGGQPKTGKSILTLNIAFCIASGQNWLDFAVQEPNKTLLLQSENSYFNQRRRLKAIWKATQPPWNMRTPPKATLTLSDPFKLNINDPSDFLTLSNLLKTEKPQVLILDPLVNFHSCDENDNTAMGDVMQKLRQLVDSFDASVIIVHHTRKPAQKETETGVSLRGASAVFGAVDTTILLTREKKIDKTEYYIDFDIRNDEQQNRIYLDLDPEILWFLKTSSKMTLNQWVTDMLIKAREDGIKQFDLVKLATEKGYGQTRTKTHIKAMIDQEIVKTDKAKQRVLWYHSFYEGIPF